MASEYYNYWKDEIKGITKSTNKSKFALSKINPLEHKIFEANMKVWLKDHPLNTFKNPSDRKEQFEKFVKTEYDKVLERALNTDNTSLTDGDITTGEGTDSTPTQKGGKQSKVKANKEDLTPKEPEAKRPTKTNRGGANPENRADDPELKIDLAKVTIIPNALSRGERAKFLRENENTISQDEYDRIFKKQNDIKLAKGN